MTNNEKIVELIGIFEKAKEKQDELKERIKKNKEFTKKMKMIEEEEKRREEEEKKELIIKKLVYLLSLFEIKLVILILVQLHILLYLYIFRY